MNINNISKCLLYINIEQTTCIQADKLRMTFLCAVTFLLTRISESYKEVEIYMEIFIYIIDYTLSDARIILLINNRGTEKN